MAKARLEHIAQEALVNLARLRAEIDALVSVSKLREYRERVERAK